MLHMDSGERHFVEAKAKQQEINMLSRQYQACSLTPVTGSGSISEALAAAVSLLKHL